MLCAYQAEQGNLPARVALIRLPGREELRQKNLFSVAGEAAGWAKGAAFVPPRASLPMAGEHAACAGRWCSVQAAAQRPLSSYSFPSYHQLLGHALGTGAGIKMTWHPQGDYLAVQVDKWTKTKKSTTTHFEIFSIW
jgi:uncharacterized protein with WD repeat